MLSVFAERYSLAQAELAGEETSEREDEPRYEPGKGEQPGLFDGD